MLEIDTALDITGKVECQCSLEKQNHRIIITPKSIKIICITCNKQMFYRRIEHI